MPLQPTVVTFRNFTACFPEDRPFSIKCGTKCISILERQDFRLTSRQSRQVLDEVECLTLRAAQANVVRAGLSFNQLLYAGGRVRAERRQAALRHDSAVLNLVSAGALKDGDRIVPASDERQGRGATAADQAGRDQENTR